MSPASSISTASVGRFFAWWQGELKGLLPNRGRARSRFPSLILCIDDDGFRIIEGGGGKQQPGSVSAAMGRPEALAELATRARAKSLRTAGIRLRYGACFKRTVEIPAGAEGHAARLLALDLQRNSPFPPSEIRTAFFQDAARLANGRVAMRQLIIKRGLVEGLIESVEAAGIDVVQIDVWNEDGTAALPVNFLDSEAEGSTTKGWIRGLQLAGGAACIVLAGAITYLVVERHESALTDLRAQTAKAKASAFAARDALTKSQQQYNEFANLYRLRAEYVSKPYVLEELTRLIPDNAWVNDMRIEGTTVDITGLAASASGIIKTLERSAAFTDASLTAPLTFDPREDKERFSIRVHMRSAAAAQKEARE